MEPDNVSGNRSGMMIKTTINTTWIMIESVMVSGFLVLRCSALDDSRS
jgi:hypothetical protein